METDDDVVEYVRVPLPWGGERVDMTRLTDGRIMCCICFEYFPGEYLYRDEAGVWDMCRECGKRESQHGCASVSAEPQTADRSCTTEAVQGT